MSAAVAAGVPPWTEIDHLNLLPLLMVVVAVVVAVVAAVPVRHRIDRRAVLALVFGGLLTPQLVDVTGLVPAIGIWFLALLLGSAWLRRSQPR